MLFYRKKPEIEGFDTETYHGNLLLIASSEDYKEPKTFEDAIKFLWYHGKDLNFFFNIGFDFSVILKMYLMENKDESQEIRAQQRVRLDNFIITFISGKGFSIIQHKRKKRYFDISQFYTDGYHRTLDSVAKEVLGIGKNDEKLEIDRKLIGEQEGYYQQHREKIIEYCKNDALLTKQLAIKKVNEIHNLFGIYPQFWYSSASISKAYLEKFHANEKWAYWSFARDKMFFNYTTQSYFGGIFISPTLGFIADAQEIDINSAYPFAIANLYSLKGSKKVFVKTPSKDCDYGFYHVKVKFNGLIPYRTKTNIIYPISPFPLDTVMTAIEYWYWVDKTEIQFIDGYELYTTKDKAFPEYEDLYKQRQKLKKDKSLESQFKQWGIKIILNATYGCFAQSKGGFTYWTNFVYSSYITAITRIIIYKAIEKIGFDNVISVLTDSIIFHNYKWNDKDSDKLGDFKLEFSNNALITYMSGLYAYENEINNDYTMGLPVIQKNLKKRGFPTLKIEDLKGNDKITIQRIKVKKLLESIIQHKIELIGDFFNEGKDIDLKSNLHKYDFPVDKLTFDYLNNHALRGYPILITTPQHTKHLDMKLYKAIMYGYRKYMRKQWGNLKRRK